MAYSKLVKICQDFALGKQSINTAIANLEVFHAAWLAEHGTVEQTWAQIRGSPDVYNGLGRHNQPQIPRAMVSVEVVPYAPNNAQTFIAQSQSTVRGVSRTALGQWFIEMDGSLGTFWGAAWPVHSLSGDLRFCKPVTYLPTGPGLPPGVIVSTYESTGAFDLAEYSFDCVIYGY